MYTSIGEIRNQSVHLIRFSFNTKPKNKKKIKRERDRRPGDLQSADAIRWATD